MGEKAKKHVSRTPRQEAIEFKVPSDPKVLKIIRLSIAYLCDLAGFSDEDKNGTTLAVDEACANIIRHAYNGAHDKPIIVSIKLLQNGIKITLTDFGKSVRESKIKSRDLDDIRPGGLGVHLIKSVMSVVSYDTLELKGNRLTLEKYVHAKKEETC